MKPVKTEYSKRAFDGKWVHWGLVPDPRENYEDWKDREAFFPMIWVPLKVLDKEPS